MPSVRPSGVVFLSIRGIESRRRNRRRTDRKVAIRFLSRPTSWFSFVVLHRGVGGSFNSHD